MKGSNKLECLFSLVFQVLHSRVGSEPYPQTRDKAGKASPQQTF